jgi:hypothetical protein
LTTVVTSDRHFGDFTGMAAPLQTLVAHPDDTDEARRFGMRDRDASAESSGIPAGSTFPLPDADLVTAAWSDRPPAGVFPSRPDKAKTVSGAMLAVGAALLLFVPVGGVLFLVAGGLGLAIAFEASVGGPQPAFHRPINR